MLSLNNISQIATLKAVVDRAKVLPLNEAQLRRQAIGRMAHTSTSIEGNKLAEYQVHKVLAGQNVNADWKSIQEVKNYQEALKLAEELSKDPKLITLEQILELHAVLMKGLLEERKIGHFRPGDVYIVDDLENGRENVRYKGPDAKKVAFLVSELLKWIASVDSEFHPVVKAAIFHSYFVNIHPFSDGNGRITRLLTQYMLNRDKWDFKKIIVLEDYYNRNRSAYYDALKEASGTSFSDKFNFTHWIEYFTNGYLIEASKVGEQISSIGFGQVSPESETVFLDKDELQIMDFLSTTGRITSDDVMDVLGIAKRTSQLKLKSLVDKGLLRVEGSGPSTAYTLKSN